MAEQHAILQRLALLLEREFHLIGIDIQVEVQRIIEKLQARKP